MSENILVICLAVLCVLLILACLFIVIYRDTDEFPDNVLRGGREAIEMAQRFNVAQEKLNAEIVRFLKAEDDYQGRKPLAVRMAGYRASTPEGR